MSLRGLHLLVYSQKDKLAQNISSMMRGHNIIVESVSSLDEFVSKATRSMPHYGLIQTESAGPKVRKVLEWRKSSKNFFKMPLIVSLKDVGEDQQKRLFAQGADWVFPQHFSAGELLTATRSVPKKTKIPRLGLKEERVTAKSPCKLEILSPKDLGVFSKVRPNEGEVIVIESKLDKYIEDFPKEVKISEVGSYKNGGFKVTLDLPDDPGLRETIEKIFKLTSNQ